MYHYNSKFHVNSIFNKTGHRVILVCNYGLYQALLLSSTEISPEIADVLFAYAHLYLKYVEDLKPQENTIYYIFPLINDYLKFNDEFITK